MWLGRDQLAGGEIEQEQPERSWNKFGLRLVRVGSPNPLSWSSKVLRAMG
jgi:hypothetical protein